MYLAKPPARAIPSLITDSLFFTKLSFLDCTKIRTVDPDRRKDKALQEDDSGETIADKRKMKIIEDFFGNSYFEF
jgi:hypothetical protein